MTAIVPRIFVIFLALIAWQCSTPKPSAQQVTKTPVPLPPTAVISAYPDDHCFFHPGYVATPEKHFALIHTRIEGHIEWATQSFPAKALLLLTPYHYPQETLILDAKGMQIHSVTIPDHPSLTFDYDYDQRYLTIHFGTPVQAKDTLIVAIDYTAQPNVWAAIDSLNPFSERGLYFIDPLDTLPYYPRQAWTQGQTNGSSVWFPTIDHPNQRMTQELLLTVADSMVTFSNGQLKQQLTLPDNKRQDHWILDKPHAPYLAAFAVGNFDIVDDTAGTVPIAYYMEPTWSTHAAAVFGSTKAMLPLFEQLLGVPYPWPAYRQIAVRDFIAGGMENTGATIMYDNMNVDARSLQDRDFEGLIAHELFHQWFGDMVTTESWPQLVLNEGMASYGEYLWAREVGGKDREQHEVYQDNSRYMAEVERTGAAPIVRFYEPDPGSMFNRHTYQKGAQVWRMLENYLGRETFFAALQQYLSHHAYQSVDLHDFRLAFEAVSGKDLLWFFDQWLVDEGHPVITVDYQYNKRLGETTITLSQQHNNNPATIYRLPIPIYIADKCRWIDWHSRDTLLTFNAPLTAIRVDPERTVLAEWQDHRTADMWQQAANDGSFFERLSALTYFSDSATANVAGQMRALQDKYWAIREIAINTIATEGPSADLFLQKLQQLAVADPNTKVRAAALSRLLNYADTAYVNFYRNAINDDSYGVVAKGLIGLTNYDPNAALVAAQRFEDAPLQALTLAVGYVYAYTPATEKASFFIRNNHRINRGATAEWYGYIGEYFRHCSSLQEKQQGLRLLAQAVNDQRNEQLARFAFNMMKRIRQGWLTALDEIRLTGQQSNYAKSLEALDDWTIKQLETLKTNSPHAAIQEASID